MNFFKTLLTGFVCLCSSAIITPVAAQTSVTISNDAWRSDLRYFQELIHSKYPNLFYNITSTQFDNAVASLDKKIGKLSDTEMNVEFVKLVALFQVGHTNVRQRFGDNDSKAWVHPIPVRFYLFSDGLYIKSIDARYKEAAGGRIVKIGNTPVAEAIEKIRPAVAFENEQGFKNMIQYYLNLPEFLQAVGIIEQKDRVSLTYLKEGKEKNIVIAAENMPAPNGHGMSMANPNWVDAYQNTDKNSTPLWMKEPGKLRYFEYLPETKTVYVKHSGVQDGPDETIADFFARVFRFVDSNDVDKFVLDIRLNGGGNNYLNKSVITGIVQARKINRKGHLFIITGKATFSAAQNLTNELEKYSEAIFVGEPTSENVNFFGDTRTETLPNSQLKMGLSWMWWQNQDPRDKRKWTAPQLATEMSFDDYQKGNDPAMNTIMSYKKEAYSDEDFRNLVSAKKYDEALTAARKYLEDPLHRYYKDDVENKINNLGYSLMGNGKPEEANKVLEINVQLFPGSANVYDSYAESFLKLGKKEEAIKFYNIAISKDPNGPTGEGSRNALKQMGVDRKGF
ncbi:MAG TPA: tetratricopeptide repeat protein [Chitinophagaceae bacterium]|jgi:tetratricopeptide (TPR) repeat protein|nr:tetratricopeptide repeat protein [Chitinophagaceae bacterium]